MLHIKCTKKRGSIMLVLEFTDASAWSYNEGFKSLDKKLRELNIPMSNYDETVITLTPIVKNDNDNSNVIKFKPRVR